MIGPLKLVPIPESKVWGGERLALRYHKGSGMAQLGETWELWGGSRVACGPHAGRAVAELCKEGEALLGSRCLARFGPVFPLLFKFIDAADKLSVQVHPDDAYAAAMGARFGKSELWYVIDAPPGATLIGGLKGGCNRERLAEAMAAGTLSDQLASVAVAPGDFLAIPAGTVHALTAGLLVAEVQQSSDLTFRLYDWDRLDGGRPRELHIDRALDVIDFGAGPAAPMRADPVADGDAVIRRGPVIESFATDHIAVGGRFSLPNDPGCFRVLMVLSGEGELDYSGGSLPLAAGDTVLLPAALAGCVLAGDIAVLHTYCQGADTWISRELIETVVSMTRRCEQAIVKLAPGTSQHTLQINRIGALGVACALLETQLDGRDLASVCSREDLERARAPIDSLIAKSAKAQSKLKPGSWQHTMTANNLAALRAARPLIDRALCAMDRP